jgi:hypothetical protein
MTITEAIFESIKENKFPLSSDGLFLLVSKKVIVSRDVMLREVWRQIDLGVLNLRPDRYIEFKSK